MDSVSMDEYETRRWKSALSLTMRGSKFAHPLFEGGPHVFDCVQNVHLLIVGAGGLGCEMLKSAALSGFRKVDIIDMDTIDVSNLNRQFLFRESDVGRYKAEVAAEFVKARVAECNVTAHNCKIQDKPPQFYRSFGIVLCGLDSIEARRWLNQTMCDLVKFDADGTADQSTVIPIIDGGTEGFKGNARIILPHMNPCVECTLGLYPPQINFPMCTIANTPRLPEHCVEYVKLVLWDKESPFGEETLDNDNPAHLQWVYEQALKRAKQYKIEGVDMRLTVGVLKRVIPAVASTNAIIAGVCVSEAFKLSTNTALYLDNYVNFEDVAGANFSCVSLERNPNCNVCGTPVKTMQLDSPTNVFGKLIEQLGRQFNARAPRIYMQGNVIYTDSILMPEMVVRSQENLTKTFAELGLQDGCAILVTDDVFPKSVTFTLKFNEQQ